MAKQLDKNMMRMMSVTERFKYQNDLKRMKFNISEIKSKQSESEDKWCHYSGMPSPESYKDEPITLNESDWVDRDDSDWDSSSDGKSSSGESSSDDDSNEY